MEDRLTNLTFRQWIRYVENRFITLTFKQWVRYVFDHEVKDSAWYFDGDAALWEGTPTVIVDYLTQLFNGMPSVVEGYSDAQVNQGLWYIANPMFCNYMRALTDSSVSMTRKIRCVQAMFPLFRDLFAPRCSLHLGHLSEDNPLDSVCYMWWDLLPLGPSPDSTRRVAFDKTILDVMQQTLLLNSPTCQQAALHGLGHWASGYPREVKDIIEHFLKGQREISHELRQYAQAAQTGSAM